MHYRPIALTYLCNMLYFNCCTLCARPGMLCLLSRAVRAMVRGVMHVEHWVRACVRNGFIIDRLSLPAIAKCFILIVARCARVQA